MVVEKVQGETSNELKVYRNETLTSHVSTVRSLRCIADGIAIQLPLEQSTSAFDGVCSASWKVLSITATPQRIYKVEDIDQESC
jgi:hypothetical protein